MAESYPVLEEAAEELQSCLADEAIRARIEAREDYERRQRTLLWQLASKDGRLAEKETQLAEKETQLAEKKAQLAEKEAQLAEKEIQLADLKKRLAEFSGDQGIK